MRGRSTNIPPPLQEVWETSYTGDTRTVEVHVAWLRSKIEDDTSSPRRILTVRGVGYMLTPRS
ncbi:MAG: helix-turn-helix domain-containing protein [Anaerolineae bacterium]